MPTKFHKLNKCSYKWVQLDIQEVQGSEIKADNRFQDFYWGKKTGNKEITVIGVAECSILFWRNIYRVLNLGNENWESSSSAECGITAGNGDKIMSGAGCWELGGSLGCQNKELLEGP